MLVSALKKISFRRHIEISRSDHICVVRARDASGQRAWYYVMVDKDKRDLFKEKGGPSFLKLTEYGQILHSGFGREPPEVIKELMEEEYSFKE